MVDLQLLEIRSCGDTACNVQCLSGSAQVSGVLYQKSATFVVSPELACQISTQVLGEESDVLSRRHFVP